MKADYNDERIDSEHEWRCRIFQWIAGNKGVSVMSPIDNFAIGEFRGAVR